MSCGGGRLKPVVGVKISTVRPRKKGRRELTLKCVFLAGAMEEEGVPPSCSLESRGLKLPNAVTL